MAKLVVKGGSRPPWVGLAAALWVEIAAGNAYNFPLYSPALKSVMGLNQQQLTMLGGANDIGENVGLLPGMACNKFPPWAVLSVGVLACFLGYGVLWLVVVLGEVDFERIQLSMELYLLLYHCFIMGFDVFPILVDQIRGLITFCFMSLVDHQALLWLALVIATNSNAWFGTAVVVTNMRKLPSQQGHCFWHSQSYDVLYPAMYSSFWRRLFRACPFSLHPSCSYSTCHLYLLATAIIETVVSLSDAVSYILAAIVVIFLISPLAIPVKMTIFPSRPKKNLPSDSSDHLVLGEGSFYENDDASDVEILLAMGEGAVKKKRRPKRVTILNNLAQIGVAFGLEDTTILLALFSFCNFVGRIGSGAISEHFVRLLLVSLIVKNNSSNLVDDMCTYNYGRNVHSFFALALDGILYTATALLGISYGILYAGVLAGYVYDTETARQGSSTCLGPDCFKVNIPGSSWLSVDWEPS
ncbi:hypothetical protein D5086_006131 [Populus alba]|uniref:Uncharacterized protein n=1 Tax=Populus alba TaxID=43335 RepID=A0ACC4CJV2_POPAL